jgi:hypothetical protein
MALVLAFGPVIDDEARYADKRRVAKGAKDLRAIEPIIEPIQWVRAVDFETHYHTHPH